MAKYEELTPIEKRWVDAWIEGIAWFIAESPNESTEETKREFEEVKKLLEEKKYLLAQKAIKWRKELLKVFGIE